MQETPKAKATETVAYSLYPEDKATVEVVAERNGSSASQAIRQIIRDWARQNLPQTNSDPAHTVHPSNNGEK